MWGERISNFIMYCGYGLAAVSLVMLYGPDSIYDKKEIKAEAPIEKEQLAPRQPVSLNNKIEILEDES